MLPIELVGVVCRILDCNIRRRLDRFSPDISSQPFQSLPQALSKRAHYGKFVAEAKFLDNRAGYSKLIEARDAEGIMALLTNTAVEKQVIALLAWPSSIRRAIMLICCCSCYAGPTCLHQSAWGC